MRQNNHIIVENQFKPGDIVIRKDSLINRITNKRNSNIGILIGIWGKLYEARLDKDTIKLFPFPKSLRIKVLSPKKFYTKDEQDRLSRFVMKDCIGKTGVESIINWANMVRPNTFDSSSNIIDVESNRYYKLVYDGIK